MFTSTHGDLAITDYMCQTLATAPSEISPTKFHNSVHNAAAEKKKKARDEEEAKKAKEGMCTHDDGIALFEVEIKFNGTGRVCPGHTANFSIHCGHHYDICKVEVWLVGLQLKLVGVRANEKLWQLSNHEIEWSLLPWTQFWITKQLRHVHVLLGV